MALSKSEAKLWASLRAKGKRHGIGIKRVGPANVLFSSNARYGWPQVAAQLVPGGRVVDIMNARIAVKKKRSR